MQYNCLCKGNRRDLKCSNIQSLNSVDNLLHFHNCPPESFRYPRLSLQQIDPELEALDTVNIQDTDEGIQIL